MDKEQIRKNIVRKARSALEDITFILGTDEVRDYLNSLVREDEIAIFNDHLIPVTEEQLKDGGYNSLASEDEPIRNHHRGIAFKVNEKETDTEIAKRLYNQWAEETFHEQTFPQHGFIHWLNKEGG